VPEARSRPELTWRNSTRLSANRPSCYPVLDSAIMRLPGAIVVLLLPHPVVLGLI
jgi:hypothetical protein